MRQAAASVIPYYNIFEEQLVPFFNRNKGRLLGKRVDATVVDQGEINAAYSSLSAELKGTWNPFRIALNLVKRFFGSSSKERAQEDIQQLQKYSGLYDNYIYANDTLNFVLKTLNQQISKQEGLMSKVGFGKNKKIAANPIINDLKSTFRSWLQPFEQILSGGIKGVKLYQADVKFLQKLVQDLRYGSHAKYISDLADDVERVVNKILSQQQKQQEQQMAAHRAANPRNSIEQAQRLRALSQAANT